MLGPVCTANWFECKSVFWDSACDGRSPYQRPRCFLPFAVEPIAGSVYILLIFPLGHSICSEIFRELIRGNRWKYHYRAGRRVFLPAVTFIYKSNRILEYRLCRKYRSYGSHYYARERRLVLADAMYMMSRYKESPLEGKSS